MTEEPVTKTYIECNLSLTGQLFEKLENLAKYKKCSMRELIGRSLAFYDLCCREEMRGNTVGVMRKVDTENIEDPNEPEMYFAPINF